MQAAWYEHRGPARDVLVWGAASGVGGRVVPHVDSSPSKNTPRPSLSVAAKVLNGVEAQVVHELPQNQ